MKIFNITAAASALLLAACSGGSGWSVTGNVADAPEGTKIAVEGFNAGRWYNIDSVALDASGNFAYHSPQGAPYPDVYRLGFDGRCIYFPIDSLDHITVTAKAPAFDTDFTVEGSTTAKAIMDIDKTITAAINQKGATAVLADTALKADLNTAILNDSVGVLAFYVLNKSIGGQPLYSATNRKDVAMLGATAQKFATLRPADPRTKILEQQFIAARKAHSTAQTVVEAQSVGLLDITLYDEKGNEQDLKKVASGAPVTLLSFTSYAIEPSLPYNVILNRLNEKYGGRGLKIYQVGFDTDEVEWRNAASNLPWITVFCHADKSTPIINGYNVTAMPLTYIINASGDITKRVENPTELEAEVARMFN